MQLIQQDLFEDLSQPLSFGKTYQEYSIQKITLSAAFWLHSQAKSVNYSLQGKNGQTLVVCLDHSDKSIGESLMLNISDSPNDASVCLLSQVLEQNVSEKYFLSTKACLGILRRAEARGKREDITRLCEVHSFRTSQTVSGKNYTPPILASHGQKKWLGNQEAFCGDYYIKHAIGVGGQIVNAAISNEVFPTLLARQGDAYVVHSYGLNGNTIGHLEKTGSRGTGLNSELSYTLVSSKKNAVVYCGTKNDALFDIATEIAPTVRCGGKGGGAIHQAIFKYIPPNIFYLARYLTEIECERLQGFPDNYTNVKGVASGKRYKALGNSMAVSVMKWIGLRIQKFIKEVSNEQI